VWSWIYSSKAPTVKPPDAIIRRKKKLKK
jgi:hypothetical protein